jgi:hypothetical protein
MLSTGTKRPTPLSGAAADSFISHNVAAFYVAIALKQE